MINLKYIVSNCPICNSRNSFKFKGFENRTSIMPTRKGIYILKCFDRLCMDCTVIYSNPMPSNQSLNKYYSSKYFNSKLKPDYNIKNQIRFLKKIADKKDKILEIGSSNDYLVKLMKNQNFKMYGSDLLKDKNNNHKRKYSIILMNHVLEHLSRPKEFIINLKKIMLKKSYLVIEVPDIMQYKKDGTLALSSEHLMHYSKKSLIHLLNKCGFNFVFEEKKFLSRIASIRLVFNLKIENNNLKFNNKDRLKIKNTYLDSLKDNKKLDKKYEYWKKKISSIKNKEIYFWGCNIIFLNIFSRLQKKLKRKIFLIDENYLRIKKILLNKNEKLDVMNPYEILQNNNRNKLFFLCALTWKKEISKKILSYGFKKNNILIPKF